MSIKAGIYGAAGYTGLELIKLLNGHPEIDIAFAASDSFAGEKFEGAEFVSIEKTDLTKVDLVFLCTPHGASAPLVAKALKAGAKVVDLSADLRLKTPESYQQWYGHPHPVPELLPVLYGLPELNREQVQGINCVANPGCYPTTTLLGLAPLAKASGIKAHTPIIVDAKSGVSGAGRKPKPGTHFVEVFADFKPYNIGRKHRHTGEIEQELHAVNADITPGQLIFSPHLLPIDRGLLATSYISLAEGWTMAKIREIYEVAYQDEPLVNLLPAGEMTRIRDVARTNGAIISLHEATDETVIIVSATDNLLKGASSQALQNANLMLNLPETMGLL